MGPLDELRAAMCRAHFDRNVSVLSLAAHLRRFGGARKASEVSVGGRSRLIAVLDALDHRPDCINSVFA